MGFEVQLETIPIKIIAKHPATGEECTLIHHIKEPATSEWKEYNRRDSGTEIKRNKIKWETKNLEAAEWLYDRLIQKVEGYTKNGVDIMTLEDFKSLVPIIHKQVIIRNFGEVWTAEEEKRKNAS